MIAVASFLGARAFALLFLGSATVKLLTAVVMLSEQEVPAPSPWSMGLSLVAQSCCYFLIAGILWRLAVRAPKHKPSSPAATPITYVTVALFATSLITALSYIGSVSDWAWRSFFGIRYPLMLSPPSYGQITAFVVSVVVMLLAAAIASRLSAARIIAYPRLEPNEED